ncbi:iron-sulfur cluster biosynthesis family protein [Enterococcus faecium]|uniref:iron-sulfur cluster biosynthesis family protein n=1 Tax=Enterococcus faecium TaxID=1352 RepID=UPI001E616E1C|nr:iron-sulfur cluster biosynthesis family protein [Enterococcus faecium]
MNDCASAGENQIRGCSLSRAIVAITPQHSQHLIIFVKKSVAIPTIPCEEATVKTSEYDTTFINGHLVLEVTPSNQTIRLKNESGILDSNVQVYFDSSDAS